MIFNIDAQTANKIISESPTFKQFVSDMALDPLLEWKLEIQRLFPLYNAKIAQKIEAIRWIIKQTEGKYAALMEFHNKGFEVYFNQAPALPKLGLAGAKTFIESF